MALARWVYDTVMQCTAATLSEFAANPRWLGGIGAFTLVLHTWTQDLRRHVHVHALMACGALQPGAKAAADIHADNADTDTDTDPHAGDGTARWVTPRRSQRFLFPVHALSKVFKGKFMHALQQAITAGQLPRDPARSAAEQQQRALALRRHDWVVYAKSPLAGPAAVLDYLSRYTHRTAIGNERLLAIKGDKVLLRVRADGAGKRTVSIDGVQFIERFLQHVLPSGFKRIRHYGLLAPALKTQRLALARRLLEMPQANPRACEQVREFMQRVAAIDIQRCAHCKVGRWFVIETLPADRTALVAMPCNRGPP